MESTSLDEAVDTSIDHLSNILPWVGWKEAQNYTRGASLTADV